MTTAPRAFRRSVEKKKTQERPTVAFTLDWVDDEDESNILRSDTFHATMPSDERLFIVAAMAGNEDSQGTSEAAAVMDMLKDALPLPEFRTLKQRLLDPDDDVNLEMLQDVMYWLMEEWASFPTQPASASSGSQASIGAKSTGRVRSKESIHSPLGSTAS
jgi:hypothetical protein